MKKFTILLFGAAIALTACNDDGGDDVRYFTLDFESVPASALAVSPDGANLYTEYDGDRFTSYHDDATDLEFGINEGEDGYNFWNGGIAVSRWTNKTDARYLNQCSVYGDGGYNGSKTFAVVYYSEYNPAPPSISFRTASTERRFESVRITNTTYAVLTMENGNSIASGVLEELNGWLLLTIEGFDASGASTGTKEFYLADFRTANSPGIVKDWAKVNLSSLGKVHKLTFTVTGSETGENGLYLPAYFCFDDLTFMF